MHKRTPTNTASAEAFRVPDAAKLYSIGANVLFAAIKRGELEASKLGDSPRSPVIVTRVAMNKYVASRRIAPRGQNVTAQRDNK